MKTLFSLLLFSTCFTAYSQEQVSFSSADGLKITADLYYIDFYKPFIILSHQARSSRGEYIEIAKKLNSLGFNCLALDLRSGEKIKSVPNLTAKRAKSQNLPHKYWDAKQDIVSAIQFLKEKYKTDDIILFGSSYSASLSLVIAAESEPIKGVIAFSPGEYFEPDAKIKPLLTDLDKPVFLASTKLEYKYAKALLPENKNTGSVYFKPEGTSGVHGAKALWTENEGSKECWFYLTQFLHKLESF